MPDYEALYTIPFLGAFIAYAVLRWVFGTDEDTADLTMGAIIFVSLIVWVFI